MRLFVDTSGWVALFDRSDKYHRRAARGLEWLRGQHITLFTSDYIVDETLTYLLYACGQQVAVNFGQWALSTSYIEFVSIDEEAWLDAWHMFQAYKDKAWAFTDCTSFILMQQHSLWQAFSFDHHFEQAGFQLWPA